MSPISPSCRAAHYQTPPRLSADSSSALSYDSPMLTPSPLRRRPLFPPPVGNSDQDDIFLQSPFKSPPVHRLYPPHVYKQHPVPIDDDEGSIFLSSSSAATSPFFPASVSQPLRTPVKEELRTNTRSILKNKHLNVQSAGVSTPSIPSVARVGVGTKRKSSAQSGGFSTPLRQPASTPLSISAAKADPASGVAFHRLAPLCAPRFGTRTPQSKAETDAYVKRHTETMKRLRIRDMDNSDEDWGVIEDDDSGCEVEEDNVVAGKKLFVNRLPLLSRRSQSRPLSPKKPLLINMPQKGSAMDEVTEAISPGGHILKRRARSRPVSLELLESVNQTPSPPASSLPAASSPQPRRSLHSPPVSFPSVNRNRMSIIPNSSSPSNCGSPMPRRRLTGSSGPRPFVQPRTSDSAPRAPMTRLASSSSASLFFGPSIPQTANKPRSRTNTTASNYAATAASLRIQTGRASISNRHSYAGPGSETMSPLPWSLRSTLNMPSPDSSPISLPHGSHDVMDDEDDMFFEPCEPPETSFVFSVTEGTPSPRSKKVQEMLPSKYKPRDSGVAFSDDEDTSNSGGNFLSAMPRTSTSASSLNSDAGDDLVTPGVLPGANSGWPTAVILSGLDDGGRNFHRTNDDGVDVDAFILRTLTASGKPSAEEFKKPPGTPVKKLKNTYLGGNRPWQSAVAAKVGFDFGGLDLAAVPVGKMKNGPRKSLPAAFPPLGPKDSKLDLNGSDSDEDGVNSPSSRKESNKYEGLGLGRPPAPSEPAGPMLRTRWLMRRSSSGAFSSGSETSIATPTRRKDWPIPLHVPPHLCPTTNTHQVPSEKPGSRSSSNSSVISLNSPTLSRRQLPVSISRRPAVSPLHQHAEAVAHDKSGRFEKEFAEIDQIGSGEFGKVLKVRSKNGPQDKVWAVKRSKPFEGPRHRLRLREEVDILQHLARAAAAEGGQHSNVLAYIDSWEQDEVLFIRTELCELGNFERFLWEYGRAFPRLEEARVWKIFVDLSNGLRFIHDLGVIHLDLKPANIFLTREGRFKIGDFGMASLWPRVSGGSPLGVGVGGFEREGDKVYLAREVLQGTYGKAADIFSFGMMMLETATNIVVPDQGDGWHRLRQEDLSQVDLDGSPELFDLIKSMMRTDPVKRVNIHAVYGHPVVQRARSAMERTKAEASATGSSLFAASPLAGVSDTFLEEILDRRTVARYPDDIAMDLSP
ncbi:hypothetical protein PAXINDRAFT_8404 [Paxillus involutus ATCC 200175]|nr:hypothetical protein PAXINDRAFT_8404 [Paxillus involutus ATCC 200175]